MIEDKVSEVPELSIHVDKAMSSRLQVMLRSPGSQFAIDDCSKKEIWTNWMPKKIDSRDKGEKQDRESQ
ncbi:hypothetical protein GCK72_017055 [Caenorhabditis remanei]|uniref:Uncharacterized protein n=1 Tax=Caenorhabditis remanei TaxID=31234 RepID=A0A6A5G763_CAERE|nr:hypothetical protein GCK72_017055 [Caenorhabditis remanei]KAF1750505.1 hypothetical protein GCK72_017055 [Caenorhabditis remanei]